MKINYLLTVTIITVLLCGCSVNRKIADESTFRYSESNQIGTTIRLKTPRITHYDLTIDNKHSLSVVVGTLILDTREKEDGVTYLETGSKGHITIENVPPGDHTFLLQTSYKYPLKNFVSDTIRVSTTPEDQELTITAKKPKYSTGYNILVTSLATLYTSAAVGFVILVTSWPQH